MLNCFYLIFVSKPHNCLAGHGRAGLKKTKYPRSASRFNGQDFAGYERSGLIKSWTVPSLLRGGVHKWQNAEQGDWYMHW